MEQGNEKKQQELTAAYDWLPKSIKDEVDASYKDNEKVETLIRDAYLSHGEEKIDGKWVVDPSVENFESRLRTLLAEERECRLAADNIEEAASPDGPITRMIESLRVKAGEADDRTGEITIKEFVPVEVKKEDFPLLAEAVTNWLEKIWSLRNQGGLIGEYLKRMSLMEDEINGIKPAMTFDKFANGYVRNLISNQLSGLRMTTLFRREGLENALKTSDDLKKLKEMDIEAIKAKAVEIAVGAMTEWQLESSSEEVESLKETDPLLIERMRAAQQFYDLVRDGNRTGSLGDIKEIKQFIEQVSKN